MKQKSKKKKLDNVLRVAVIVTVVAAVAVAALLSHQNRQYLVYSENLDAVAVKVDYQKLTLTDLAFYVLYEEQNVEEKALAYDPENTRAFWNVHTNQAFVQADAKDAAMDMAVHDYLFYNAALENGIALNEEEKQALEQRRTDFWEDLYDVQKENLPVDYEVINDSMRKIALAEKYQMQLAAETGKTYAGYSYDGYDYEQWLEENDVSVKVNKKVWDRVNFGNVTLVHDTQVTIDDK